MSWILSRIAWLTHHLYSSVYVELSLYPTSYLHSPNSSFRSLVRHTLTNFFSFHLQLGNSNTSELNVYMSEVSALLHKEGLDSRTTLVSTPQFKCSFINHLHSFYYTFYY